MSIFLKKIILLYKQEGKIRTHITYTFSHSNSDAESGRGEKNHISTLFI